MQLNQKKKKKNLKTSSMKTKRPLIEHKTNTSINL